MSSDPGTAQRILVVDDNEAGRYAKCRILRQAGFTVVEATSGAETFERLREAEPDLVLLDVRLPDISGIEVCRRLKENPATSLIPVLQMSASFRDDKDRVAGLEGGADGYVVEPMDPALLLATVAACLRTRRAEQAVRELAIEWQATFDAIADGVALVDTAGNIVRSNRALASLLNRTAAELIGAAFDELFPSANGPTTWRSLAAGQRRSADSSVGGRFFSIIIDPVFGNQRRLRGGVCIVSDVTERKRMDEQLWHTQKLESIGVLAGGVAHDFNNLLMGILGHARLGLESLSDPPAAERALRDILRASERAADLTRQLLAYAGKGRVVVQAVDVSSLVSEMVPLITASFPRKARLAMNLASDLPAVQADKTQLEQVVMNLLINAAEAVGERAGTVEVTTRPRKFARDVRHLYLSENEVLGEYVSLEVCDDGVGMEQETLRRIFDPFFTTKFLGRGLGLSAVLGIVRSHRGAIRVSSVPDQGTTFELLFPAAAAAAAPATEPGRGRMKRVPLQGTVLVVDDEEVVRKFFDVALRTHGYKVVLAKDGAEALRIFRKTPGRFSLVLLDLVMPVMSGKELLPLLFEVRPGARIAVTSGQVEEEVRRDLAGWPIAGFIQKPCSLQACLQKIRAASALRTRTAG
jgi:PAS domain S-box-containing protein